MGSETKSARIVKKLEKVAQSRVVKPKPVAKAA